MQEESINQRAQLISIGDASEYLGISIDTLRRWEKKGRIQPFRSPGGHRYYNKIELDNLFGKRYVRDEPTIRSSKDKEAIEEEKQEVIPEETKEEESKPRAAIGLPSWRAIKEEPVAAAEIIEEKTEIHILERPVRQINIPEAIRIRVASSQFSVSSTMANLSTQNTSILTPGPASQGNPVNVAPNSTATINSASDSLNLIGLYQKNKKAIIYSMVIIGVILLILGWYFAWEASQKVLSPVPQ